LRRIGANGRFCGFLGLYLLLCAACSLMQPVSADLFRACDATAQELERLDFLIPFQAQRLVRGCRSGAGCPTGAAGALRCGWGAASGSAGCALSIGGWFHWEARISPLALRLSQTWFRPRACLVLTIVLVGLGGSTAPFLIPWSLLPDAIDCRPWTKPAGLYTAWMVITQKLGIGLAVFAFWATCSAQRL